MESARRNPAGDQRLIAYDEAWRLTAQPVLLARKQTHWKLSRAWGLADLIVMHRVSDLDAVGDTSSRARGLAQRLLGDTAPRILYNEPYDEAQAAGCLLGLTSDPSWAKTSITRLNPYARAMADGDRAGAERLGEHVLP